MVGKSKPLVAHAGQKAYRVSCRYTLDSRSGIGSTTGAPTMVVMG